MKARLSTVLLTNMEKKQFSLGMPEPVYYPYRQVVNVSTMSGYPTTVTVIVKDEFCIE